MMWRGFDGGQDVRNYIDEFFDHRSTSRSRRGGSRMSDITFAVLDVAAGAVRGDADTDGAGGIASVGEEPIHAIALRCQVRIEPRGARTPTTRPPS